jgi:hypothetical protein
VASTVQCPVDDSIGTEFHLEVNAIRILPEVGDDFLLDFVHFKPLVNKAFVVRRVRLHKTALRAIEDRLQRDMVVLDDPNLIVVWPESSELN